MSNITRVSLNEINRMKRDGELQPQNPNAKPVKLPDGFWDNATMRMPEAKTPISLRVDPDILEFFRAQGEGHLTRMHAVLRAYVDAHKGR